MVISPVVFKGCHWPNPHGRACPAWRPCDGLALAVATRLGVKLGTVVEMRVRSNALVCFEDGGDWSSQQTGHSSSGGVLFHSGPTGAAVDTMSIPHPVKFVIYSDACTCSSFFIN